MATEEIAALRRQVEVHARACIAAQVELQLCRGQRHEVHEDDGDVE
jgi:hypothetical protein